MKIRPKRKDTLNWCQCVPTQGDLLFFDRAHLKFLKKLPFSIFTSEQIKDLAYWNLNNRSWYGYARKRAPHCMWIPKGGIEALEDFELDLVGAQQIKLGVPTLINSTRLPKLLIKQFLNLRNYVWVTAKAWIN
jgi:hypothetical protein